MAYVPFTKLPQQFFDNLGNPLVNGTINAYLAGTSTPTNMFSDDTGTVAGASVTLDSRGEPTTFKLIWLDSTKNYKFILKDSTGATIWTIDDIEAGVDASDVNYTPAGVDAVVTTVQSKLREIVSVLDFGAVGDGVTDDSVAFTNAIASGAKRIFVPSGTYFFASAPVWTSLTNITFIGDSSSASLLRWDDGRFAIKSPSNVSFERIGFSPNPSDTLYPEIFVSNYTNIKFENCRFEGFGATGVNKAGSTCMYLYAGDVASSTVAAGDSQTAAITNCEFAGNGRRTNFGVRVYTEFSGSTAINVNNRISNCTFSGFNWNAVEIAGPETAYTIVSNCVALLCGLIPFDLDKGCHDCTITDCVIRRLLGNIDTDVNPNTSVSVCGVQGRLPESGYSYNNTVQNIVAFLRAADIAAYDRRCAAVGLAYVKDCTVKNISVYLDSVPAKPSSDAFGFACVSYDTISNCVVDGVNAVNASAGIMQTGIFNANMTYAGPNYFRNIKNVGTMKAEFIVQNLAEQNNARSQCVYENISLTTDLSEPWITTLSNNYGILAKADFSSLNFALVRNSTFNLNNASAFFACHRIAKMGFENVTISGIPVNARFIHSEGSTTPQSLGLDNVFASSGQNPLDLSTLLQNLDQSATVLGGINEFGTNQARPVTLFSSAQPTYPPVNLWNQNIRVERIDKASGSYIGWTVADTSTLPVWKTYGTVAA